MSQPTTSCSSPTLFEQVFNLPKPACCSHGDCCKGASPSVPYHQLWEKAANGDAFAQGFLSLFVPYASHEQARTVVPGLVERTLKAASKNAQFAGPEDVVFYRCRYLQSDNRCGVYEDRPQFCRDYPDTPFVVMAPGCAYENWGEACRSKYHAMKADVARLDELKQQFSQLTAAEGYSALSSDELVTLRQQPDWLEANWVWAIALTSLFTASPATSCLWFQE